jgi:transaldolase
MSEMNYLQWLSTNTGTAWWHDSGDPKELERGLANGAVGVTTNPVLSAQALKVNKDFWRTDIEKVLDTEKNPRAKAESLMKIVVTHAAKAVEPVFRSTNGVHGYACAQVDPAFAGNREGMYEQAKRFTTWGPNIAIKLPATLAGLDVMDKCCAEGITTTITVSFCVPQVWAIGSRYQKVLNAAKPGAKVGKCFPVVMIGRLDDYLRDVFADNQEPISESELRMAGLSVVKHAYQLYRQNGFQAMLLIAALRGNYHMTGLAGGALTMSIHPSIQKTLLEEKAERTEGIDVPIPPAVQEKLYRSPEFRKAFEKDGLSEKELISFGVTQKTLAQFTETGWRPLEQFQL